MNPKLKYYPLCEYLKNQPKNSLHTLAFDKIEEILGAPLPASAKVTRAWWSNSDSPQGKSWREAGWVVDDVDFRAQQVAFRSADIIYRITPRRKYQGWTSEQIKALREFAGWSQQQLADKMGTRQQTISEWETGMYTPRRSTTRHLQLIAREIGFPYKPEEDSNS
ncbi:MAG: helix-turn-helix transcriptional regulator [Anaerolineae bacterium]